MASASGNGLMPICSPSGATRRTSRARIRSLIRGSSFGGGSYRRSLLINAQVLSVASGWARRTTRNDDGGRRKADIRHDADSVSSRLTSRPGALGCHEGSLGGRVGANPAFLGCSPHRVPGQRSNDDTGRPFTPDKRSISRTGADT